MTPLHCAAGTGHSSVVDVLIRSHADVNAVGEVSECSYTLFIINLHLNLRLAYMHSVLIQEIVSY